MFIHLFSQHGCNVHFTWNVVAGAGELVFQERRQETTTTHTAVLWTARRAVGQNTADSGGSGLPGVGRETALHAEPARKPSLKHHSRGDGKTHSHPHTLLMGM